MDCEPSSSPRARGGHITFVLRSFLLPIQVVVSNLPGLWFLSSVGVDSYTRSMDDSLEYMTLSMRQDGLKVRRVLTTA